MTLLRIYFVDFWLGFVDTENFLIDVLSKKYKVVLDEKKPDFIFYSNFGMKHKEFTCGKIFFSTENERPNMFKSDLAITMDYNNSKRHFRLPLFVYYIHQYKSNINDINKFEPNIKLDKWRSKKKFCCAVISNGNSKIRNRFLAFLNSKEIIDSGGRFENNVGGPVEDKLKFINDYKFVLSFENSKYDGYTTEKILEPMLVNSIPIYWGNNKVNKDFEPGSFINVKNKTDFERVYLLMKEIESDEKLALTYLNNPKLIQNTYLELDKILCFIEKILYIKVTSNSNINIILAAFIDYKKYIFEQVRFKIGLNFR